MLKNVLKTLWGGASAQEMDAHIAAAREHLVQGQPLAALGIAEAILGLVPEHPEALYLRGTARLDMGEAAQAVHDLRRAAELRPEEPRYLYNLAVAHWNLGEPAASVKLCRQIVARKDFNAAHVLLASTDLHGDNYFDVLARIHEHMRPGNYLEIGVAAGQSLRLALPRTLVLGVDPSPRIQGPLGPRQRLFAETSDHFFAHRDVIAELGGERVDMAFIDGMHRFEFALRDFANIERLSRPDTVVLVHDCWPLDRQTAERERRTQFWSGDIWRLILLLKKHRPELIVHTIAAAPTGLGIVLNLDASSRLLHEDHERLVEEFLALDYSCIESADRKDKLGFFPNDWSAIRELLDSRPKP